MERRAFAVTPMHPIKDKRARLRVAARYIKNGTVKFHEKAASCYSHNYSTLALKNTTMQSTRLCILFSV